MYGENVQEESYKSSTKMTEHILYVGWDSPEALFTKLLRIAVWSKIAGQLSMKPSLSLRTEVTERKTKESWD